MKSNQATKGHYFQLLVYYISGLAYRGLANIVKPLFGKKKYYAPWDPFIKLYLKHLLSAKKIPLDFKVTSIAKPTEGPCSHALRIMHSMNFSAITSVPYIHTKFKRLGHADRNMDEWCEVWEKYFNLGDEEESAEGNHVDVIVNYEQVNGLLSYIYGADSVDHKQIFNDKYSDYKTKFEKNKKQIVRETDKLNICVHIRRGDISLQTHPRMWTHNADIINTLVQLANIFDNDSYQYQFHIFSQGQQDEFAEFKQFEPIYHLDEDPVWTAQQLANADILIMAKSSYSYLAALYSEAVVIYETFTYPIAKYMMPPLGHWIIRETDGSFDESRFLHAIEQQKPRKAVYSF